MSRGNPRAGRISLVTVFVVAAILMVVAGFAFSRQAIAPVGARFMDALARGDAATLAKLSDLGGESPEEVRRQWDFAVNTAGRYYRFTWDVLGAEQIDDNTGYVRLHVQRNVDSGGSYDENFQLKMVRVGGEWKVAVREISREMFPGLPR